MCSYLGGSGYRIDMGKSEVGVEEKCWVKGSSVFAFRHRLIPR
jgi:hypothetical protein